MITAPRQGSGARGLTAGAGVLAALLIALAATALWHLTQGTSGASVADLLAALAGEQITVGGVPVGDVFTGSRLPRLAAGAAVGIALGVAGALLHAATRNALASPDTLGVASGASFALAATAAVGVALPLWASGTVAFLGGLIAAVAVLALTGRAAGAETTRIILAGSAVAMALNAGTGMLLILFKENTTGLYAWGNGSLAQLNIDAALRALPVIAVVLTGAVLMSRRLDVLRLGEDGAASLGVPVKATRYLAIACAVLLTSTAVTLAGPIAFVGLGAPVLARMIAVRVRVLQHHALLLPLSGLLGALLILLADAAVRAILTPQGAAAIPTGVPTALLGGLLIVLLALRLRDAGSATAPAGLRPALRSRRRFLLTIALAITALAAMVVIALLAGSLWLRLGDIAIWLQGDAPALISRALGERAPRAAAAVTAGAALAAAGCIVQGTVRNPLAEPGILGITAGAGLGAVLVVTLLGGSRPLLVAAALTGGLLTFAAIAALSWRRGFLPDRFVLIGIGCGYALTAVTTFLLLSVDPWKTPRLFTWLSGTTYGRSFPDVVPAAIALALAVPALLWMHRRLDLISIDEDTPRLLGVRTERTRLIALTIAAVLAASSVVAIGVVGFVGLLAPHLARGLVGSAHRRSLPVAMLLGGVLTCAADTLGRTLLAPAQLPAGLMIALIGAPYFLWLLRRSRR